MYAVRLLKLQDFPHEFTLLLSYRCFSSHVNQKLLSEGLEHPCYASGLGVDTYLQEYFLTVFIILAKKQVSLV